jgi:hypothetical protein
VAPQHLVNMQAKCWPSRSDTQSQAREEDVAPEDWLKGEGESRRDREMLGDSRCDGEPVGLLTVDYRIKVHMDLQADKSPVVVKGPFFPRVVNPRYRIRGTMCNARIQSNKARKAIY